MRQVLLDVLGMPYQTLMWDMVARDLRILNIQALSPNQPHYVNLSAVVLIRFRGLSPYIIARGKGDVLIATDVLAKLLKSKLIEYHYTQDLDLRLPYATPMVDVRIPAEVDPNHLPFWAHAIADGVGACLSRMEAVKK